MPLEKPLTNAQRKSKHSKDGASKKLEITRKKVVNKKPSEQSRKGTIPPSSVIPVEEFNEKLKEATTLCKELVQDKTALRKQKLETSGPYRKKASKLGELMSSIVSGIKNAASVIVDAQIKSKIIAEAKLPSEATKAANTVLKQLSGSHRRIQNLNDTIAREISRADAKGVDVKVILKFLPEIKDIYDTANTARVDAQNLYQTWNRHINQSAKIDSRNPYKSTSVTPAFKVHPKLVQIGEAQTAADKKALNKIGMAKNLGATPFPDPYTAIWSYYADKSLKLDTNVRMIVRYIVMYAAKTSPLPKLNSVLELYNGGQLLKESKTGEKFDASKFNTNFKKVLENIARKVKNDPKLKEFVFEHYEPANDTNFQAAVHNILQDDSRGYTLIDNARKHYIEAGRGWFNTYMPEL